MIVYILGTIMTIILSIIAIKSNKEKHKKIFMFLSAIPLTLIAGLRYGVGQDYFYTYVPSFVSISNGYVVKNYEFGFTLLNKIVAFFSTDYIYLFLTCAVFFSFFTFKSIYEQSKDPVLSIFLFVATQYYFIFMNGMRQMMVVCIFLYSFKYIKEKKFSKYLLLNLIGFSFHSSSLIAIPYYFIANKKITPKKAIIIVLAVLGLSGIIKTILIDIIMGTKYSSYIESVYDTGNKGYIVMAIEILLFVLGLIFYPKDSDKESNYSLYFNSKMISTILACLDGFLPLMARVKWYFGFSSIIFIPHVLSLVKTKKNRIILKTLIIFFYTIYILYTIGMQNANKVLPYISVFER